MMAQLLDVGHQVRGRVVYSRSCRRTLPATTLIEQHNAVEGGVEKTAMRRARLASRAAVDEQHGKSRRIAAFLEIDAMTATDGKPILAEGFDCGIKDFAAGLVLIHDHARRTENQDSCSLKTIGTVTVSSRPRRFCGACGRGEALRTMLSASSSSTDRPLLLPSVMLETLPSAAICRSTSAVPSQPRR